MTEKISRRGVKTPDSYEPDILEKITVAEVMQQPGIVLPAERKIEDVLAWLEKNRPRPDYFIISDANGDYKGLLKCTDLYNRKNDIGTTVASLTTESEYSVYDDNSLRSAVEKMAAGNVEGLPVMARDNTIKGIISFPNILTAYRKNSAFYDKGNPVISLKRRGLKVILKGQKMFGNWKR